MFANLIWPHRSCQVEEEPEDSDDDQPSYRKTYKEQWVPFQLKALPQPLAKNVIE